MDRRLPANITRKFRNIGESAQSMGRGLSRAIVSAQDRMNSRGRVNGLKKRKMRKTRHRGGLKMKKTRRLRKSRQLRRVKRGGSNLLNKLNPGKYF